MHTHRRAEENDQRRDSEHRADLANAVVDRTAGRVAVAGQLGDGGAAEGGEGKPDALFSISFETGEKRQLTHPQPPVQADTSPAVSPDGRWLVYRRTASLFNGELYRLPLGTGVTAAGEPQRLTVATLDANHPTWMPGSKEILFSVWEV